MRTSVGASKEPQLVPARRHSWCQQGATVGASKEPQLVPAHSLRVIQGSTQHAVINQEFYALVEYKEVQSLQHGLAVGRAYVTVDDTGNIPVQIAKFSDLLKAEDDHWMFRECGD